MNYAYYFGTKFPVNRTKGFCPVGLYSPRTVLLEKGVVDLASKYTGRFKLIFLLFEVEKLVSVPPLFLFTFPDNYNDQPGFPLPHPSFADFFIIAFL